MKVTKYPQSCLVLERDGKRLLIDPGSFVSREFTVNDLLPIDGILITHEHLDHVDPDFLEALIASASIPVIGNESTKNILGNIITKTVVDGESFEVAGYKIIAKELPHCDMMDGTPGPQNTGFIIDDVFFHPGDGIHVENIQVEATAVPLAGPDISPRDVFDFIKGVGAKKVVPIHYHAFPASTDLLVTQGKNLTPGVTFVVISEGQSADI